MVVLTKIVNRLIPRLEKIYQSKFNGPIEVHRNYQGYFVLVNFFQQSGPFVKGIWTSYFSFVKKGLGIKSPKKFLLIGLAGNATIKASQKIFGNDLEYEIVEIDPVMIGIANEYFNVSPGQRIKIHSASIFTFMKNKSLSKTYDIITYDAFNGGDLPGGFSLSFLNSLLNSLSPAGKLLINIPDRYGDRSNFEFLLKLIPDRLTLKIFNHSDINRLLVLSK